MTDSSSDMAHLTRNDSSSVISSLQMDYGDSDEEDNSSKNNSRNDSSTDITVTAAPPVDEPESEMKIEMPEEAKKSPVEESDNVNESDVNMVNESAVVSENNPVQSESAKDERKDVQVSPVDFISDDEDGGGENRQHRRQQQQSKVEEDKKRAVAEAVSADSPSSQGSAGASRKATRLVSYGPDEDLDEDESESEEEADIQEANSPGNSPEAETDPVALSRSVQKISGDDIKIPPEPPGRCHPQLQDKIIDMYDRMKKEGMDLNRVIQNKKSFRNPSIYDKLIDFCHIDEKGTNFPPEIYDPHIWGKESFYDELDKAQRKDMERREKEKKERTKIEFMTGTKKSSIPPTDIAGAPDEKKRKTKWDAQPAGMSAPLLKAPGVQNPGVVNLTSTATGTKATVISAIGSLSKKPSSSGK